MAKSKFRPRHDRVVVKRIEAEEQYKTLEKTFRVKR